ncbi:hypothetical protein CVT25_006340 [Psilocybe cyanescens]|uniref:Uncharacterized protein n=1 Tax=Psilocybe cyanescens TaxID=93625 RepID=A0A409XH14_PSICY|nr:hypothetical protein CVT25_006340 [Psilocybe cyanescens]
METDRDRPLYELPSDTPTTTVDGGDHPTAESSANISSTQTRSSGTSANAPGRLPSMASHDINCHSPAISSCHSIPINTDCRVESRYVSSNYITFRAWNLFMNFLLDYMLRQIYLLLLLRLPTVYFSRVSAIFEESALTLSEIKQMALEASFDTKGLHHVSQFQTSTIPIRYKRLDNSWNSFVNNILRDWNIYNVVAALILPAILTILQIDTAAQDPLIRYTLLFSQVCAVVSLLHGCLYSIRFDSSMRKTYKAAQWANEAQRTQTNLWWNIWVLLAMPAIWLGWSSIFYIIAIMSFVWRTDTQDSPPPAPLSPHALLIVRILISLVLALGLASALLSLMTFHQYGQIMDTQWAKWINDLVQERANRNSYGSPEYTSGEHLGSSVQSGSVEGFNGVAVHRGYPTGPGSVVGSAAEVHPPPDAQETNFRVGNLPPDYTSRTSTSTSVASSLPHSILQIPDMRRDNAEVDRSIVDGGDHPLYELPSDTPTPVVDGGNHLTTESSFVNISSTQSRPAVTSANAPGSLPSMASHDINRHSPVISSRHPIPISADRRAESLYAFSNYKTPSAWNLTMNILLDSIPRQIYLHLLLRLPAVYFSRVSAIFEESGLTLPEIKQMAIETTFEKKGIHHVSQYESSTVPIRYERVSESWNSFVDSLLRDWNTYNIVSALILSAILTILQIDTAAQDPPIRYTLLVSQICAVVSLLLGCLYSIRFDSSMRKTYKAAEWALEAQRARVNIWWNIWVLLAMPAIWLACPPPAPLSPHTLLIVRILISLVLALGLTSALLSLMTFRQYGQRMDSQWAKRVDDWVQERTHRSPYGSPEYRSRDHLGRPVFPQPGSVENFDDVAVLVHRPPT